MRPADVRALVLQLNVLDDQIACKRETATADRGRQRSRCGGQVWSLRPKYRLGIEGASGHAAVRCGHSGPSTDWG